MIVTPEQMKQAEESAFASGVEPDTFMEQAGEALARSIHQFFPRPGQCRIFCGKGNNAGDALVAARWLAENQWEILVDCAFPEESMSDLSRQKLRQLQDLSHPVGKYLDLRPTIVLDALLGLGADGEPREPIAGKIQEINRLRNLDGTRVFAVDFPSGLDPSTGEISTHCVRADVTVTFGAVKTGLLADSATDFVGRLVVVPLDGLVLEGDTGRGIVSPTFFRDWLPPRRFDSHKGKYGHVAIIAGSMGYFGAARLCALGALHAGAGLVTVLTKPDQYPYLAPGCPPEVMVQPIKDFREAVQGGFDAIALGPGLVNSPLAETVEVIRMADCPVVVDAGAFEVLAGSLKILRLVNGPRILTPHPGEMEGFYHLDGRAREDLVADFVEEYPCVLLLKGARTLIGAPGRPLLFNPTGSPGMATGGMGDVLSGVIAALAAQGLKPSQAAALGAWVCGRAAEYALVDSQSVESLTAGQIPDYLGAAFQSWKSEGF